MSTIKLKETINDDSKKNYGSRLYKKIGKIKNMKRDMRYIGNPTPVVPTTTERKSFDNLKDSTNKIIDNNNELNSNNNNDSPNTSVDLRTSYGEEGINFNTPYDFNFPNSSFSFSYNKKTNDSNYNKKNISQESNDKTSLNKEKNNKIDDTKTPILTKEKNNQNNDDKTPIEEVNINNSNNKNEENIPEKNKNEDFIEIRPINIDEYQNSNIINTLYNIECYKTIKFKELMFYKKIEYENQYDLNEINDIFQTKIIYQNKECNLVLNKEYLYILENKSKEQKNKKPKNNEYNPDFSFINKIKKDKSMNELNEKTLKLVYELSHPLVCLNFNLLSCKLLLKIGDIEQNKNNKSYELKILILGSSKEILFFIKDYEIYKKFAYLINSKIYQYDGYKINRLGLSLRTKTFYKDTYISVKDFELMAKTGDLLLFRTIDCISDCQRFLTRDQYDHTAIIIRKNGIIELFESTSTDKCNLLEWSKFKYRLYNLVFRKIVLRRLNIEEEDPDLVNEIQERIEKKSEEFITKVDKKDYVMSIPKMIFTSKPEKYEIKGEWDKADGFCCSALNAAFYIHNGIMKLEKSVHCVRPGDFEQDKNRLTILPGYSFGPEKIIEFSDDFLKKTNYYKY